MAPNPKTVDAYIASFPPEARPTLEAVRAAIREAAPGTEETISYGMPTYKLNGRGVVTFARWKRHISIYVIPSGDPRLDADLAPYKAEKSTLQFPIEEPMPLALIGRVAARLLVQARRRAGR
ncbi:MAG: iron chaperone [Chloroflexota bacterium]